jgi:hypothetical protein
MKGMTENGFINTKAVSYSIEADLDIPDGGAEGVVLSQAGQTGGWSLYVKDGKPKYAYNWLAREMYTVESDQPLPAGRVTLTFDFAYDGGGLHKGATGTIAINGRNCRPRQDRQDHGRRLLTGRETADVGTDAFSPVTDDYDPWNNDFTGTINKITIRLNDQAHEGIAAHTQAFRN